MFNLNLKYCSFLVKNYGKMNALKVTYFGSFFNSILNAEKKVLH